MFYASLASHAGRALASRAQVELALSHEDGRQEVFCVATSTVVVHDADVDASIRNGELAIGQLFRHYNVLPCFTLLNAGRNSEGFWRLYDLDSKIARCNIREEFRGDTFELHLPASMRSGLYGRWTASTGAPEEEL